MDSADLLCHVDDGSPSLKEQYTLPQLMMCEKAGSPTCCSVRAKTVVPSWKKISPCSMSCSPTYSICSSPVCCLRSMLCRTCAKCSVKIACATVILFLQKHIHPTFRASNKLTLYIVLALHKDRAKVEAESVKMA